jgi:hypothetical protein
VVERGIEALMGRNVDWDRAGGVHATYYFGQI